MFRSLRARLTLMMMVLAILPLVAVGIVLRDRALAVQRDQALQVEAEHAGRILAQARTFIEAHEHELRVLTTVRGLAGMTAEDQTAILLALITYNPNFRDVAYVDGFGNELIHIVNGEVVPEEELQNRAVDNAFLIPRSVVRSYYSPVELDEETGTPHMVISVPAIHPTRGDVRNVLIAKFDFSAIWELLAAEDLLEGEDVYLVDTRERVIAHRDPLVVTGGRQFVVPDEAGVYTGLNGEQVVLASQRLQLGAQFFDVVSELTTESAYEPVRATQNIILTAILLASLLIIVLGTLVVTRLSRPLVVLADAARRLGAGDFTVRAAEKGGSELSAVAHSFNDMAGQLEDIVETLEQRVDARMRDLQLAARLSEQVATILDPDELLPQVVELTKSNFNLYHTHIYLADDAGENLVLTAGAGEPGRVMLERGHRIPIEANSLVARAARDGELVVVHDVNTDPNFLANPLLPLTRSEAAVPLSVRGSVVGVLDVQSETEGRFDTDLQSVLLTMAGQIAVAISNAKLFAEVEVASRHEHVLSSISSAIQGATSIEDVLQTAARELGRALHVPHTAIELNLSGVVTGTDGSENTNGSA